MGPRGRDLKRRCEGAHRQIGARHAQSGILVGARPRRRGRKVRRGTSAPSRRVLRRYTFYPISTHGVRVRSGEERGQQDQARHRFRRGAGAVVRSVPDRGARSDRGRAALHRCRTDRRAALDGDIHLARGAPPHHLRAPGAEEGDRAL